MGAGLNPQPWPLQTPHPYRIPVGHGDLFLSACVSIHRVRWELGGSKASPEPRG